MKEPKDGNGRLAAMVSSVSNPTSLQFGPDGRLYVSQQDGLIKVLTIIRDGPADYSATQVETISLINQIPNHNDNGTLATEVTKRQITSLVVAGTSTAPILYVSSSDSRIGGPSGDLNLDTNSGIISKLTKTTTGWDKVDLVRGLPRSEENHANNGMQLDGTMLYVVIGGNTNAGGPSTNFAYTPEYALSTAVLSINLATIEAMPVQGSGINRYKYNLPTLDDPTRAGNPDAGDPFGGNDGLNQAKIDPSGPVQVFATGFRNAYDLVITKTPGKPKRMFVTDNGANQGWGGHPANEGVGTATNNYITGEPGSTKAGPNDPIVNNLDNLHYVGDLSNYTPGSFYGGHPNPIRANPAGAGLYTHSNGVGVWRTSKTGTNPLPADWPPVPLDRAHPIEGDYQNPGETDNALLTYHSSTNGIVEYTASGFSGTLKGHLLAASFDGTIQKITLDAAGTGVLNTKGAQRINQDLPIASNFGAEPLDLTAQGDNDIFPGTIWAACYGGNSICVFEPEEQTACEAVFSLTADDDGDGFSNADEMDNGSNPCSIASKPKDSDGDKVSDFNDPNDDNDSLADEVDFFPLDPNNGKTTNLPITYELFNNYPGTGLYGLGFTGLMLPKQAGFDYQDLFDEQNIVAGGAVGALSVVSVSEGDPYQSLNNQENGFQFGVNVSRTTGPFTVRSRMLGPFFNGQAPKYFQSQGLYIGSGDQENYLKLVVGSDGAMGGLEMLYEKSNLMVSNGFYSFPGGMPNSTLDLYLSVDPVAGTVQPKYAKDGGPITNMGPAIPVTGALLNAIQGVSALAVGIISTSLSSSPFTATWDMISVKADAQAEQAVVSLSLMNADSQQEIKVISPGEQLDLFSLPTRNLSIRANVNSSQVGSVVMELTGNQMHTQTESTAPYALFGDSNGKYTPWNPAPGSYNLTATPYTNAGGAGTAGTALSVNF
ncbi:MAG TPA: thrombospondin type 3 repeat-containing protein, partial [Fibrella sp.]